jgi:hypothetical protein
MEVLLAGSSSDELSHAAAAMHRCCFNLTTTHL